MKARFSSWANLMAIRSMVKLGAEAMGKKTGVLKRTAAKSEENANAIYVYLRLVYYENAVAGRHDIAAELATVAADICRPRGAAFEPKLADALYWTADSSHRAGRPALAVLAESLSLMERHLPGTGAPYAVALGLLAELHHADGRHEEAVDAAQRALDLERRLGSANVPAARLRVARVSA